MTRLVSIVVLVACGGSKPPPNTGSGSAEGIGNTKDTRTQIERRRDDACEKVGKKMTDCALADAKDQLEAGKITKAFYDETTAPEVLAKNTAEWVKGCTATDLSSRQVRVLEVCYREEPQCGPLVDCLKHLKPEAGDPKPVDK